MNRYKVLFFFILFTITSIAYAQKPLILCEKSTHDFGKIPEDGGSVVHTFIIKNVGKAPLLLTNAHASCGCTTPEWTKQPILPGKTGTVKVTFDPKGRPGVFTKTIAMSNNAMKKALTLIIRGNVIEKEEKK